MKPLHELSLAEIRELLDDEDKGYILVQEDEEGNLWAETHVRDIIYVNTLKNPEALSRYTSEQYSRHPLLPFYMKLYEYHCKQIKEEETKRIEGGF